MQLIERVELTSTAASISFSNIPQDGTDLLVFISERTDANDTAQFIQFNSSTTGYSARRLLGTGSAASSASFTNQTVAFSQNANFTASTFGNHSIYIPNYTSSNAKSFSTDTVTENNGTTAYAGLIAGLWTGTAAVTSLMFTVSGGNYLTGTSIALYKITKGSDGIVTVS